MMKGIAVPFLLLAVSTAATAMPPRQGLREPAIVAQARKDGRIDRPDGEAQRLKVKFGVVKIAGSRSYPVVMGTFTDQASSFTQAQFQSRLFGYGSGVKSVNMFYRDMSYNAMACSGSVCAWGSSGNTKAYYANGYYGLYNTYPQCAAGFIVNLLTAIDAAVDFSDPAFDADNDYTVDVLWVVHSGKGAEETNLTSDLWSHSSNLSGWSGCTAFTTNDKRNNKSIKIDKYIIMPEMTSYGGEGSNRIIGCGVFCHEFGHALGLPDLYDTGGYTISGEGLGNWACMAAGSWGGDGSHNATPVSHDVWSRRFLGWISPYNVTVNGGYPFNKTLADSHRSTARLAKKGSTTASEYWLAENRSLTQGGSVSGVAWDAYCYSGGLLVFHVDDTYTTSAHISANDVNVNSTNGSSANRPYGVALEETDQTAASYTSQLWSGTNRGNAADAWTSTTQANFDSMGAAYPVTYLNDGTSRSGTAIRKIPAAGKGGFAKAMFCTLYVNPGQAPLGVELSQFSASVSSSGVTLSWRTESEFGSYQWSVQRAVRDDYQEIAAIPAYGYATEPHEYSFTDHTNLAPGTYYYRLTEISQSGERSSYGPLEINTARPAADRLWLSPASPNPAAGQVTIAYALPRPDNVSLKIYNLRGAAVRTLVDRWQPGGRQAVPWDGRDDLGRPVPSGIYIYQLRAGGLADTRKLTIVK